jgi:uncharacterized protein YdeI (YjbR/CyaY-like superfamily)
MPKITFFKSQSDFRKWFVKNHDKAAELLAGFYKKSSGKPSITWPESVDEALCFGWIDGIRRNIDDVSYSIRFTPRRRGSIWSAVNIKRAGELRKLGLMQPAGMKAFEKRDEKKSKLYSYENKDKVLSVDYEKKFKANKKAWAYFKSQPPWYQRTASHWVISAKQEETRLRRLEALIKDSENQTEIKPLSYFKNRKINN